MRSEALSQPRSAPLPALNESRSGPSVPHLVALAGSAVMAGAFAPDAMADGVSYLRDLISPLNRGHLPYDFAAKATAGAVGTFNTVWFMYFAIKAGREPGQGAPLTATSAPQSSAVSS